MSVMSWLRCSGIVGVLAVMVGCATQPSGDPSVLLKPDGVEVTDGGLREVDIAWTAPIDGSIKYRIQRSDSAAGDFENVGEAPPAKGAFKDQGGSDPLADSKDYYYRLVAVAVNGDVSEPSDVKKAVTAPPPAPPADLEVTAPQSRGVKLEWTASESEGVTEYIIERAEAAAPDDYTAVMKLAATEFLDGGTAESTLKDSTLYLYRVRTVNRVGSIGEPCEAVQVTTMPPPDMPRNLDAESRQVRCVPLRWDVSPEEDVIRYDVYRSNSTKGPFEKVGEVVYREQPYFLDGGNDPGNLEDDETYYYRVRAINEVTAESADSLVVKATTREVPPRIEGVQAQVRQPREVPLSWRESPDEKVLGYEIWRAEGDSGDYAQVGRVGGRNITVFTDRGGFKQAPEISLLKDDTVYNYKIIAFNTAYARSSASDAVVSQTKPSPVAPVDLEVTTNRPYAIDLQWSSNTETDIVEYVVEASADGREFRRLAVQPVATGEDRVRAREAGLAAGEQRFYRVRAMDKDRLISEWCAVVKGVSKPVPDAPRGLTTEETPAGVKLAWEPPVQPDIKAYKIYTRGLLGGFEAYAVTEGPEFVVEWPLLKSSLKLAISAIDQTNLEGPKSDAVTVSPRAERK